MVNGGAGRDVGWAVTGDPVMADLVAMAMEAAWVTVAAEGFHRKGFCGLDIPPPEVGPMKAIQAATSIRFGAIMRGPE